MVAYNPDALYSNPVGAQSALPTIALTRMNEPGQAPQRDRCAQALLQLRQHLASIPYGGDNHNLGHFGIAATDTEYLIQSNQRPHVPPVNPGTGPTLNATDRSATQEHPVDEKTEESNGQANPKKG